MVDWEKPYQLFRTITAGDKMELKVIFDNVMELKVIFDNVIEGGSAKS